MKKTFLILLILSTFFIAAAAKADISVSVTGSLLLRNEQVGIEFEGYDLTTGQRIPRLIRVGKSENFSVVGDKEFMVQIKKIEFDETIYEYKGNISPKIMAVTNGQHITCDLDTKGEVKDGDLIEIVGSCTIN